jgi:hypothetical protein
MKKYFILTLNALFLFLFVAGIPSVMAVPVETELLLLADVSGSLDDFDFNLQRDGYEAAFRDTDVINAIAATDDGIAVSLVYWSTSQRTAVDWFHITDSTTSNAFADLVAAANRPFTGRTYMEDAMNFGVSELTSDNGFEGNYMVVDVSGDGADSEGGSSQIDTGVQSARDNLVDIGVDMINALWIDDRNYFGDDVADAIQAVPYGETNVIYGTGSFSWIVEDYAGFENGIRNKILSEIIPVNPVPEPATMLLFGLGLLGLAGVNRRKK